MLAGFASDALAASPDVILHNGKIVTVDDTFSIAEAIAIADGRIVAVGVDSDVRALGGERTRLTDLEGRTVLPGLIDTHTHPTGASMYEFDHPVPDMQTIVRQEGVAEGASPRCSHAAREMRGGPSEPPCRRRLQTTHRCCV